MRARPRIIALEGASGAGKSTVARLLRRDLEAELLTEAYDRLDPRPNLAFSSPASLLALERDLLAEERRRYREALEIRRRGRTVVADTGFFGPVTYAAGLVALGFAPRRVLARLIAEARRTRGAGPLGLPDATVYLDVPERRLRERVARDPTGHPAALARRHRAVGRFERELYVRTLPTIAPGHVAVVRGPGPPETVARRVRAAMGDLRLDGTLRGRRDRWLDRIWSASETGGERRSASSSATVKKPARSARAPPR